MKISKLSAQLISQLQEFNSLPAELLTDLQNSPDSQFLDTLAELALDSRYTGFIYAACEPVFVEISSRWLCCPQPSVLSALAAYARILPLAPHLADHAAGLLMKWWSRNQTPDSEDVTIVYKLSVEDLGTLLLAIVRLLLFDNERYATYVLPAQFSLLLNHELRYIRYLAIRIFCLYLYAPDTALESMLKSYLGDGNIEGPWEDRTIDYGFFSLWEQRRFARLEANMQRPLKHIAIEDHSVRSLPTGGTICLEKLSSTTASLGGVLVPINEFQDLRKPIIVPTESALQNIRALATGINGGRPLLVAGLPGSGKTTLIRESARLSGKLSSMITLHLNEQIDAKLLIGLYTSTESPGLFTWRPGVLTTAVIEGRWVLIEDLDRAPTDLISILLPLIENRELYISNQDMPVIAAPEFKLIATLRTIKNVRGEEVSPVTGILGFRHWHQLKFHASTEIELMETMSALFPLVRPQIHRIKGVYTSLTSEKYSKTLYSKLLGPADLVRWCRRIQSLLSEACITSSEQRISEATNENIFLEAVDSFAGYIPRGPLKDRIINLISQELQIPSQRAKHSLEYRKPVYAKSKTSLRIGRVGLQLHNSPVPVKKAGMSADRDKFATTDHVLRLLESIAKSVQQSEACLLVGETGTGKTTMIQKLAKALGRRLVVMNLSQQSEVADLLGGYKPINPRSIAVSLKAEFDQLLHATFPAQQNKKFSDALSKNIAKGQWKRALNLWEEALRTVRSMLESPERVVKHGEKEPSQKKRKLQSHHAQFIRRWDRFADGVRNFESHLSSGSKGLAFSFTDGIIVKAVRDGDWVLLDEMNLASPDLLECLADLFISSEDGGPSLLLSETGDTERVHAHKHFRIFGAMNPATDIGKRDLPLSIRSRFTEIFVDAPDSLLLDVVAVVEAYLGDIIQSHVRIATDVAKLYLDIKTLADANSLTDSSNQKPQFSLRTLTRTLLYVTDVASTYGLQRALFEGFSMSFLTMLDATSKLLLQPLIEGYIFGSKDNKKALVNQEPRIPKNGRKYARFRQYWIAQGNCDVQDQPHYVITPFIEQNLHNLVRATSTRRFPVLLQGPTSSGKTSMVEYLAKISGNKFVRINNHEHTDLQEYLGTYKPDLGGQLVYHDGILVEALKGGYWIVLDELNLAPTDVLEALNRLLDDNRELVIPETQQVVRPHENFMLFATQNPPGLYGGRKPLSRAFRNRFLELHFDEIPESELETILRERSRIAPSFCARIIAVYKKLSLLRQSERLFEQRNGFATLRDLFRWAFRDADDRDQLAINGFQLLAERVRNHVERMTVKAVIEDVMRVKIDDSRLYDIRSLQPFGVVPEAGLQGITLTRSARRLLVLVTQALKNNEPVLLVGETGSGKTTICQVIAHMMKTQLHTVNAHQNMETSDLIGCQRPVRNHPIAQELFKNALVKALESAKSYRKEFGRDLPTLSAVYDQLVRQAANKIPEEIRVHVQECRARAQTLFEWSDGNLITAMSKGQHFLLDEISLADDSVLERLNSILEPDRTLYLAEKGISDAITAVDGFQFLATMNPGGDYGKRELSLALRNRFTEIWVPPISDREEVTEIIGAKLDLRATTLAKPMVHFAEWFSHTYEPSSPVILSIRDLISWTEFINRFAEHDLSSAVFDGASMVYLDRLGASPTAKDVVAESDVTQKRRECECMLQSFFQLDKKYLDSTQPELQEDVDSVSIGHFRCLKSSTQNPKLSYSLRAPTTLKNAMKVFRALQITKPILLEGIPGVGKTTLVAILAGLVGMPLTRINLSDQTDLMDLFGSDIPIEGTEAGHFGWRDAPFLRAMQKGEWVLLDEMNLAPQTVLEGLNACFDHRGEVYISELDQTFPRHPEFVVFAAQNPQHQGGGRKGLPASFVNRFTVVYVDPFTQADLSEICANTFPYSDPNLTKNISQCVSNISLQLQRHPRLCFRGRPWEINLRDALRWLEISSQRQNTIPASNPTHYHQFLLIQRFRTPEDRAAVEDLIKENFPNHRHPHSHFVGWDSNKVEIGLGLLSRDSVYGPLRRSRVFHQHINSAIAESVTLCIEKSWPVLLVGPSGVGKSTLIRQLAGLAGAEISELCMNPEIDTMDLVGGFERIDIQRDLNDFISRLRKYTYELLVQQLASGLQPNKTSLDLVSGMTGIRIARELIPFLQSLATSLTSSQYSSFLQDCQALALRQTNSEKVGFEWVDSLLVRALKHGKWVILDNANLCNPSVLDRLNSLLEPDGYLSIHEHRNDDGSAQLVKPHPRFRLFMTMDPRHGELSRAMRNRSVELFLPSETLILSTLSPLLTLAIEPSISRFAWIQNLHMSEFDDNVSWLLLLICMDHLTFTDISKLRRWQSQIVNGLVSLRHRVARFFSTIVEVYHQMFAFDGATLRFIREAYSSLSQNGGTPGNFGDLQTIHPFNNPILLDLTAHKPYNYNLHALGQSFELLVEIYSFRQELAGIRNTAGSKAPILMSGPEEPFSSADFQKGQSALIQLSLAFLDNMSLSLAHFADDTYWNENQNVEDRKSMLSYGAEVLQYLKDVFALTLTRLCDECAFQIFLDIGRSLSTRYQALQSMADLSKSLADELKRNIEVFGCTWQLTSGIKMEVLWKAFRPSTARNAAQFDLNLQIDQLSDRFDKIRWSSRATIADLVSTQISLINIQKSSDSLQLPLQEPLTVKASLAVLEQRLSSSTADDIPFCQIQFDILRQYECLRSRHSSDLSRKLGLLSGQPTSAFRQLVGFSEAWKILRQVGNAFGDPHSDNQLATIRQDFPLSIARKLVSRSEVPLRSLPLLKAEISVLAESSAQLIDILDSNPIEYIKALLQKLQEKASETLQVAVEGEDSREIRNLMDSLPSKLRNQENESTNKLIQTQGLHGAIESVISPSLFDDDLPSDLERQALHRLAQKMIYFFAGYILLYVPDRLYDPASKSKIEQDRHSKRQKELQNKIRALETFEKINSGHTSNYRIQIAKKSLAMLGMPPEVEQVYRPAISGMGILQSLFNNILASIILLISEVEGFKATCLDNTRYLATLENRQNDIRTALYKLTQECKAYEDIIRPLIALLNGLSAALALTRLAIAPPMSGSGAINFIYANTPFMGRKLSDASLVSVAQLQQLGTSTLDLRIHFLETVALTKHLNFPLPQNRLSQVFDAFYQEWKENLSTDQHKSVVQSSLYKYRGIDTENVEELTEEFHNLFTFDKHVPRTLSESHNKKYSPSESSRILAGIHRKIFSHCSDPTPQLLYLLGFSYQSIANAWSEKSESILSPLRGADLLSPLFILLDEQNDLLRTAPAVNSYNFYLDENVIEAENLVALVDQVQVRFSDLQTVWPEQVTLINILRTCTELLAMRHSEPVAKFLTKLEQLHGYIHDWQTVASKEYSGAEEYDRVTQRLIQWRKLELSTWATLLDMEDQRCKTEADSWWFIVYETVIAAPLSTMGMSVDIQSYAVQCIATLQEFLTMTPIGLYTHRIAMLQTFQRHVSLLAQENPSLLVVSTALSNFLGLFKRFGPSISERLQKERYAIEKELKEVLMLASWKDTNIEALRQTAKRSHQKLFKIVRKYRSFLGNPVDSLLQQDLPVAEVAIPEPRPIFYNTDFSQVNRHALESCKEWVAGWTTKPDRFKDPVATAQRMRQVTQVSSTAFDALGYLDQYSKELLLNIKLLQKETPESFTKTNAEFIKRLKSRKRKLYSDTLKDLRQMGIQTNISADVLTRQHSLPTVLSRVPSFENIDSRHGLSEADFEFQNFLHLIPQARDCLQEHHEDLSHRDVRRGVGYLECILSNMIEQRCVTATVAKALTSLQQNCQTLESTWQPDVYSIHFQKEAPGSHKHIWKSLLWLPAILGTAISVIEKYENSRSANKSEIKKGLNRWKDKILDLIQKIQSLPKLPSSLTSSFHVEGYECASTAIQELHTIAGNWSKEDPEVSYVLKHVQTWTSLEIDDTSNQVADTLQLSLSEFDGSFCRFLDSMLVALQGISKRLAALPNSNDGPRWLFNVEASLKGFLKTLQIQEIAHLLGNTLSEMGRLGIQEQNNLDTGAAVCALALPIILEFCSVATTAIDRYIRFHTSFCRLGSVLARIFLQVGKTGFCNPPEDSAAGESTTEKLEGGTGLGDGEGAEDISEEIKENEDLSELAQQNQQPDPQYAVEDQEDAVNMNQDELSGELGDSSDDEGDVDSNGQPDRDDIDEETGKVDGRDSKIVDENMWDGKSSENSKDEPGENLRQQSSTEKQVAASLHDRARDAEESGTITKDEISRTDDENSEIVTQDEISRTDDENSETITQEGDKQTDSDPQRDQSLDLPDGMKIDQIDDHRSESSFGSEGTTETSNEVNDHLTSEDTDILEEKDIRDEPSRHVGSDEDSDVQDGKENDNKEQAGMDVDSTSNDLVDHINDQRESDSHIDGHALNVAEPPLSPAQGLVRNQDQEIGAHQREGNAQEESDTQADSANTANQPVRSSLDRAAKQLNNPMVNPEREFSSTDDPQRQAFRKLGEALEEWHRYQRQIIDSSEMPTESKNKSLNLDLQNQDVEHVPVDSTDSDGQVLGAALDEEAQMLDAKAFDFEDRAENRGLLPDLAQEGSSPQEDHDMEDVEELHTDVGDPIRTAKAAKVFLKTIGEAGGDHTLNDANIEYETEIYDLDEDIPMTHTNPTQPVSTRSIDELHHLWVYYENITRDLSLYLTEQLRLILAPTLATKMRGDFRTGKRLNMKRIIPYIASQYKKDKIWMRRSIPTKRNYQIMLAFDDSRSMEESGSGQLAFQTLALVSRSLSMLEAGQVCVIGFGNEVVVAHDFEKPLSTEAGAHILSRFSFQQTKTNVRNLIEESIKIFRDARRKNFSGGTDLWQLELIISDGVCEDHEAIRRLVRKAQEERIMMVFVIVDALKPGESILDMSQAAFEPDASGENKLKIKRYLDDFPFPYYVVVGDVKDLPSVLVQALRQWFTEVVDSS